MSDDLAWFPTPKEAFKQPGKPIHMSPAYDSVGSIPPPPTQDRHRHSAGHKPVEQTRHFSDSSASVNSQRVYSPHSKRPNAQHAPRGAPNASYSPANAPYGTHGQHAPSNAPYAASSQPPAPPAQRADPYAQHPSSYAPQTAPYAPYAAPTAPYSASGTPPVGSPSGQSMYTDQRSSSQPRYSQRVPSQPRAERVPVGGQSSAPSQPMQPGGAHAAYNVHSAHAGVPGGVPMADRSRPVLNPAAQVSSQSVGSAAQAPQEPEVAPLQAQGSGSADLRMLFDDVDRHKRGYLTERELSKALVNADYTLFDSHTVRLLMKMFDRDGDGAIYFAEFGQLWKYLHDWRQVFDRFDVSRNDNISFEEFSKALAAFGYTLSAPCVRFMFTSGSKLNRQGQRAMSFDMFVQSCISIKSITDTFKKYDTDRDGFVTIAFEDFLMETTKLH